MSFIQLGADYESAKEPEVAPEGMYDLVIGKVEEPYESEKGHTIIPVRIEFDGNPDYSSFMHWIVVPGPDTEDRIRNILNLNTKRFLTMFNVTVDGGFDPMDLLGSRAHGAVTQEVVEVEGKQPFNTNKLALPRLASEEAPAKVRGRK